MASKLNLSQGQFLTPDEEFKFLQYYETRLWDFCRHFRPPLPPNVSATALMYFKRFYLNNSVMDYSPRYVNLRDSIRPKHTSLKIFVQEYLYGLSLARYKSRRIQCIYLAVCRKLERISSTINEIRRFDFGSRTSDYFGTQGLLPISPPFRPNHHFTRARFHSILTKYIQYHLTIHNPYRPMEGFLIDMRVRCAEVPDVDVLRPAADEFLTKALKTDAALLFPPSIIALTSCLQAAAANNLNIQP